MVISDRERFSGALAGVTYPARTWQLWAQADSYGADTVTLEALSRLPVAVYESLDAVLTVLRDTDRRSTSQLCARIGRTGLQCGSNGR